MGTTTVAIHYALKAWEKISLPLFVAVIKDLINAVTGELSRYRRFEEMAATKGMRYDRREFWKSEQQRPCLVTCLINANLLMQT